jgi:hypothetical protein
MKNILSTLIIFICSSLFVNLYSQSTTWNLDFEEWDLNDMTPDLWNDTTIIENRVGLFPPKWFYRPDFIHEGRGLGQTTDATNGAYALALSGFYQYQVMRIISGESAEKPGWPIDSKPDRLIGDYKVILLGENCDSLRAYVDVFLTRFNALNGQRDTIGNGSLVLSETSNSYHQFDLEINYSAGLTLPDTVIVVLAKERFGFDSPPACLECSHVFFDNLQFVNTVSNQNTIYSKRKFEVFPNPTRQGFVIKSDCENCRLNITVISSSGQYLKEYSDVKNETTINTNDLTKGVYFLKIEELMNQSYTYEKVIIQ